MFDKIKNPVYIPFASARAVPRSFCPRFLNGNTSYMIVDSSKKIEKEIYSSLPSINDR